MMAISRPEISLMTLSKFRGPFLPIDKRNSHFEQ